MLVEESEEGRERRVRKKKEGIEEQKRKKLENAGRAHMLK